MIDCEVICMSDFISFFGKGNDRVKDVGESMYRHGNHGRC